MFDPLEPPQDPFTELVAQLQVSPRTSPRAAPSVAPSDPSDQDPFDALVSSLASRPMAASVKAEPASAADWVTSPLATVLGFRPGKFGKTLLGSFGMSSARVEEGAGAAAGLGWGEARERADMMAEDLQRAADGETPLNPFRLSGTERMAGRSLGQLASSIIAGGGIVGDDLGVEKGMNQLLGIDGPAPPMTDAQKRTAGYIDMLTEPGRLAAERWKPDVMPTQAFADGGWKDPAYYLNTVGGVIPDVATAIAGGGVLGAGKSAATRLAITAATSLPGTLGQEFQEGQAHLQAQGKTREEAIYEATVKGLVSSIPQAMLEGATDLKIIDEMKEAHALGRRMLGMGGSMVAEGTEEVLQAISSQATGQAMGLKDPVDPGAFGKQLIDEFAGGAIGGAFLGGGAMMLPGSHGGAAEGNNGAAPTATAPDGSLPQSAVVLPGGRTAVLGAMRNAIAERLGGQELAPDVPGALAQAEVTDATPLTTQALSQLQETVGPATAQQVMAVLAARAQGMGMPLERALAQHPLNVGELVSSIQENQQAPVAQLVQPETAPPAGVPVEPISTTPGPAEQAAPRPAEGVVNLDEFAGNYPELSPVPAEQGNYMVATSDLNTDPYLQYKVTHAGTGLPVQKSKENTATGSIEGLEYEPAFAGAISVWRNPEDQKLYVLNGNNRFALAKSQNVPFQKVRVAQAATKKEARAVAAWENIAEKAGTIIDNATFFREEGVQAGDPRLKKLFGPSQQNQAEQGLALAKLDEDVFETIAGRPELWGNAVELGRAELTPDRQKALLPMMTDANGNATKPGVFKEMVAEMRAAQFNASDQAALFGADELNLANSNLRERATIVDAVRSKLTGAVNTFQRIAGRTTQRALGEMKAEVSPEQARVMAEQARGVLENFERSRYSGEINDIINSYASEMQGEKSARARNEVAGRAVEEITNLLSKPAADSVGEGAVALFDQGKEAAPTGSITFSKDESGRIAADVKIALEDGRPVKPTSIFHEVFHWVRQTLTPSERAWAEKHYGVKDGAWESSHEEQFARDMERWARDGKAPNSIASSTWAKIREGFRKVYAKLKGTTLEGTKLTPELEQFFKRIMGDTEAMPSMTQPPPKTSNAEALASWYGSQKKFGENLASELRKRGLQEDVGELAALLDPKADAEKMAKYAEIAGNVLQNMTGQELLDAYASLSDSYEGRILDTDVARQLNPFYLANPTHMSAVVHEVSSALTKRLLAHNLERDAVPPPGGGNAFALVTAGGGGSGKGRFVVQEGMKAGADFVLDTTLSDPEKAKATIEGILASGRDARVVYVYTPIAEAMNNMIERAERGELARVVRLEAMAKAHHGAPRSILALLEQYGGDPRVTIKMAFNGREEQGRAMLDNRTAEGREAMRKELSKIGWQELDDAVRESREAAQGVIDKGWVGYDGARGPVSPKVAEYLMGKPEPKAQAPSKAEQVSERAQAQVDETHAPEPKRPPSPEQRTLFDDPNPVARKIRHFKAFYRQTGMAAPSITQQHAAALAGGVKNLDRTLMSRVWDNLGRWNRVVDRNPELNPVDTALRSFWNTQSAVIHRFAKLQEVYSGMELGAREELGLVMDLGDFKKQVFSDAELQDRFKLTPEQVAAYHERLRYYQGIASEFSLSAKALANTAIAQVKVRKDLAEDQKRTTIKAIKEELKALTAKFDNKAYVPAIRFGDKQVEFWTPEAIQLEKDRKPYLEKQEKLRGKVAEIQQAMERGEISEQVGKAMLDKADDQLSAVQVEMQEKGLEDRPDKLFAFRYTDEADLQHQIAVADRQHELRTGEKLDLSTLVQRNAMKLQVPGPLIGVDAHFAEYLMEIAHMAVGDERAASFLANEFPGIVEEEIRAYMAGRASTARTVGFAGRLMAKANVMGNVMDAHRVDAHYAATVAREVAVRENKAKIEKAISGVTNVDLRRYAQEHVQKTMTPPDTSEKIVQWIKGIAAFNNLALKPMYALQQLAQQYTSERPIFQTMYARNRAQLDAAYELARTLANPYALRRFRTQARTMLDAQGRLAPRDRAAVEKWFNANRAMLPKNLSLGEFTERLEMAISKGESGGTFDNQVYADVWDAVTDSGMVDAGIARRAMKKLLGAGTYLSGPLEELNRRRTFMVDFIMRDAMAGVQHTGVARGTGKKKVGLGLMDADNFAGTVLEAQRTVDRLHNAQGRRYYSRLETKVGSFGALAMQFKAFAIDYGMGLYTATNALYQDFMDNEVKAGKMTPEQARRAALKPAAKSVATVMVLGGALGLPMVQQLVAMVAKVFEDPEDDFLKDVERRAIKFLGGGEVAKRVVKSLLWGASNAFGYDIGSSFSMGELFFLPDQGSPAENVVALVLGASGDNMVRYWRAADALRQGDTDKALNQGLPGFARFMKRGIEGKVEAMGEKQRLTGTDRLAHFLGIRSTDTADRYEIANAQKRLEKARKEIIDHWGREMAPLMVARNEALAAGDKTRADLAQRKIDALREAFRGEAARFNAYSSELGAQDKFKITLNSLTMNAKNKADDAAGTAVNRRMNARMKRVWGVE